MISQATDAGTLLSSDMLPLARAGNTNAYHATVAEIAAFANTSVSSGAYGNIGRNLLHNAQFNVRQRGIGPWTLNGSYTADRWWMYLAGGDIASTSLYGLQDSHRAQIGDEAALWAPGIQFTGTATATSQTVYVQDVENVYRTSGKTVTLSFWAMASSGTPKIGVSWQQDFGTGGSPSAGVAGNLGVTVALSAAFTRYTMTATLPSMAGKTVGTNGDDALGIAFYLSCAPSNPANGFAGGIGTQSGTVNLWGIQLEIGSVATPLGKVDAQLDLTNCQRYYLTGQFGVVANANGSEYIGGFAYFPCTMRRAPTIVVSGPVGSDTNVGSSSAPDVISAQSFRYAFLSAGSGPVVAVRNYTASSDL
jgi:hypothetical protein